MTFGADSGLFWGVFFGLVLFGTGYNAFVEWAEEHGYTEGYTSLLVVAGVAATLAGVAILDFKAALLAGAMFVASGLPMIIGSIARYVRRRAASVQAIIREVEHGHETP